MVSVQNQKPKETDKQTKPAATARGDGEGGGKGRKVVSFSDPRAVVLKPAPLSLGADTSIPSPKMREGESTQNMLPASEWQKMEDASLLVSAITLS